MQLSNNRHKVNLPGYYFRMNSYAQTRLILFLSNLILFLSKFCQTMYCFVMIFCGDTSNSDPNYRAQVTQILDFLLTLVD